MRVRETAVAASFFVPRDHKQQSTSTFRDKVIFAHPVPACCMQAPPGTWAASCHQHFDWVAAVFLRAEVDQNYLHFTI